jgi:hypothetical protein
MATPVQIVTSVHHLKTMPPTVKLPVAIHRSQIVPLHPQHNTASVSPIQCDYQGRSQIDQARAKSEQSCPINAIQILHSRRMKPGQHSWS